MRKSEKKLITIGKEEVGAPPLRRVADVIVRCGDFSLYLSLIGFARLFCHFTSA
jgi:hypothetical protein